MHNASCSEIIAHETYEQARNAALKWLKERGFKAEIQTMGKFGKTAGKPIGMKTANGKIGFRLEFDQRHGAHVNVFFGKTKGPHFTFKVSEKTVGKIQRTFIK